MTCLIFKLNFKRKLKTVFTGIEEETISHPWLCQMAEDSQNKKSFGDQYKIQSAVNHAWFEGNDANSSFELEMRPRMSKCVPRSFPGS